MEEGPASASSASKLSVFVCWPERDQLMKTMPMEFRKNFRKCAIIIDCFEVFLERSTSLMARAQTLSNPLSSF